MLMFRLKIIIVFIEIITMRDSHGYLLAGIRFKKASIGGIASIGLRDILSSLEKCQTNDRKGKF